MISESLKNKDILFISVQFFNYENIISQKLQSLGANVIYYDERPSNSVFTKGILRFDKDFIKNKINKYYSKILEQIQTKNLDYFFLIKGEVIPRFFVEKIKKLYPALVLIYYNFDSYLNNPNAIEIIPFFDRKFTFDHLDAKEYNLQFQPLFFSDQYKSIYKNTENPVYDLTFIGTAHTDRYTISEKLASICKDFNLKMKRFYYSPSRFVFIYKMFFDDSFKKFSYSRLSFNSLSHSDIIKLYKTSKVILDINHPKQKGLTMRTFEALGSGKKLITTNNEVKKYPFYNAQNIKVIDRNKIFVEKAFFESNFVDIDEELYDRMSLNGWISSVFLSSDSEYWSLYLNEPL